MFSFYKDALSIDSNQVIEGKGKNIIPPPTEIPLWKQYLQKFKDPIIIILLIVFVLSVGVSMYEYVVGSKDWSTFIEPLGVFLALMLSTCIAFICEVKANNEFKILNKVKDSRPVKVIRKKSATSKERMMQVERCDIVVGDIVKLDAGDEVPADGELLFAQDLLIDESAFTGELYAHKAVDPSESNEGTYPANFLLRSSIVVNGYAYYRVSGVGVDTEEGKGIMIEREEPDVQTPLNKQLDQLGHYISITSFVIAGLIVVGRLLYYFLFSNVIATEPILVLEYVLESIMIAVTIIVVAVPEGLPMSVTMSLALSMRKMLKAKSLVRKLHACETMGATTIICTDKTGTLTHNHMQVVQTMFCDSAQYAYVLDNIAINSTAELNMTEDNHVTVVGNPTEGALLRWLHQQGSDYSTMREEAKIVGQIPFSTEIKSMSTTIEKEARHIELIKGAPEILLSHCSQMGSGLTKESVEAFLISCQQHAMRTLAFAYREDEEEPIFIGAVGIADPIREDVPDAIRICKYSAGIRILIVTGDNVVTAKEVARQIGLVEQEDDVCLDGQEFARMSDSELMSLLPRVKVLARAKPEDKARLVGLLQQMGEVVAVTGDGTNDAPALRKAQVGLSMGDGTVRAKEASDITIIDNSFSTINKAVMWGRSLYVNIKRFILFQMTINVSACMIVLVGAFLGLDSPLTVTQMLWINLIMDTFAALALSSLPPDPKVMNEPPRSPSAHIIDKKMAMQILVVGFLFFVYLIGLWQLLWHCSISSVDELLTVDTMRDYILGFGNLSHTKAHLSGYELSVFFTTFAILQFWNLFNVKYFRTDKSLLVDLIDLFRAPQQVKSRYSVGFVVISLLILLGQILIVNCFGSLFSVSALSLSDWLWILLCTSVVLIVPEFFRNGRILISRTHCA